MKTPTQIVDRAHDYKDNAWKDYTPQELGNWVHLLVKRAHHRNPNDLTKIQKDITDAYNYLAMLKAHIDAAQEELNEVSNLLVPSFEVASNRS